jgi:hypothetical protein
MKPARTLCIAAAVAALTVTTITQTPSTRDIAGEQYVAPL